MPNFDDTKLNEIMAIPKAEWTQEQALFVDYVFCLTQNDGGQIKPYQSLPSGNYLHNPAQKTIKSGADMAKDLIEHAAQRGKEWQEGMNNPSRDPVKAALDNIDKYKNNVKLALEQGKWEKNLGKVTHADIMKTVNALGPDVFTEGIAARKDKITSAMQTLQPKLQAVSNAVQAMKSGTEKEREDRMLANLKLMRQIGSGTK